MFYYRVPKLKEEPGYKYIDIVRKREERQRLKAFDCKQCERVSHIISYKRRYQVCPIIHSCSSTQGRISGHFGLPGVTKGRYKKKMERGKKEREQRKRNGKRKKKGTGKKKK